MAETKHHAGVTFIGTDAERIAYDTTGLRAGATWIDTDTDDVLFWNGNTWSALGVGCIFVQTANKTIVNTTTETTLIGAGVGSVTLPANLLRAGKSIRITARGINSTGPAAGTLTFRAKLGGTNVCASPSNAATNNLVNRGWRIAVDITCRTVGATGTVRAQGSIYRSTGAGTSNTWMLVSTSDTVINTTTVLAINVTAQWGTASASNTITCTNLTIEILK